MRLSLKNRMRLGIRNILAKTHTLSLARRVRSWYRGHVLAGKGIHASGRSRGYAGRLGNEVAVFQNNEQIHDLPAIFHYWSNKFLLPRIQQFGFVSPDDFFVRQLDAMMMHGNESWYRFISIGAGNCDTELRIAQALKAHGHFRFTIDCLDINPTMLKRGRVRAEALGYSKQVVPLEADFNAWSPVRTYHAVLANHALHHVLNLERLFATIYEVIKPNGGLFLASDMIGRNGHQRWPEALSIVNEYWATLPRSYKYNHQSGRTEEAFLNVDWSADGFEGIRAQDVLPLLLERFHFDLFVPFANVIMPFIDRAFGPNFDAQLDKDRSLIDAIHDRDEREMRAGRIKPTQMFAVLSSSDRARLRCVEGLSPEHCVRVP